MTNDLIRRGDVLLVSLPFADDPKTAKLRPAVVVQNDAGNTASDNLIVAAISSRFPAADYPTMLRLTVNEPLNQGSGLIRDSFVDASVLATVSKRFVQRRIGALSAEAMTRLDVCLLISLALPRRVRP